ncbi:MAG: hypothetical protein E7638_08350, partial [Ruminococcaceae bacterium]|nr:hypothetical protein [Oscillospiraceae bacterium]
MAKNIIMIPYAELEEANSGENISKRQSRCDVYFMNCCVALISAKHYNPDCDAALVTNITVPEKYAKVLEEHGILTYHVPFDMFDFGSSYKWSLAFYKLCALYHISEEHEYENYSYFDADIYVQRSFDDIWEECTQNVMLYDINHGLQVKNYRTLLDEAEAYYGERRLITHYGGEFFAANRKNARMMAEECLAVYKKMCEEGHQTTRGDEFILSIAAEAKRDIVKNAGAYVH